MNPGTPLRPAGAVDGKVYAIVYDDANDTGRIVELEGLGVRTVVPAHQHYPVEAAVALPSGIYVVRLVDAKGIIEMYDWNGTLQDVLRPSEPSSFVFLKRWGDRALVMSESFSRPMGLYMLPGLKEVFAPSRSLDLDVFEDYSVSHDGTRIHYFFVKRSGVNPTKAVIYGYGGFGVSLDPRYVGYLKPILDRGFAFVMANLKGGGEYGRKWHEDGRRLKKKNVFEDFKSVARKLSSQGLWIAGWGGSNGGLLIGAVLVDSPEFLNAAIIGYPVLDMLRFHKLYIGRLWVDEYGDPEDPKYREYLRSYSPMHNVRPAEYPPTLIYTGLYDDRVHPSHALRFAALLEEVGAPVYLRVETRAGHMGADVEVKVREQADIQAFLLKISESIDAD